ncbi:MAG: DNA mismatch endonuclease Vsr [Pseudomonadota bacterium]
MTDHLSSSRRSENMRRIRSGDTTPEIHVRRMLHRLGYRYRCHRKDLPGRPDIVFSRRRKVIFVHGCFWHQHRGCLRATQPKSREDYWLPKLRRNIERDELAALQLREQGWDVLTVWECETKLGELEPLLTQFLGPPAQS